MYGIEVLKDINNLNNLIKQNRQIIIKRDELSRFVCNIRTPLGNGKETIGTAFFIKKNNQFYLLTAEHVVSNINDGSYVILADAKGYPHKIQLNELIYESKFIMHELADLAKAEIDTNSKHFEQIKNRCWPFGLIEVSEKLISKDIELTTIGFPMGLGVDGNKFFPLTSRTYASSSIITLPRFDNHKPCDFIILEQPSIGGYSGGPVFDLAYTVVGSGTHLRNRTKLIGLVHGTISDPTGGKLAAITPCKYLNGWL